MLTQTDIEDSSRIATVPSTLVDILRSRAERQENRRGYIFLADGETKEINLTYGELDKQARAIGGYLQSIGAAGERVLLLYPPGLEYITAFFGCLYAGAIAVPAYPPRQNRNLLRLQTIMADAGASIIFTTPSVATRIKQAFAQSSRFSNSKLLTNENVESGFAEKWRAPHIDGDTLAFLQYTSGSTAAPKGVMVSHANLLHNEHAIRRSFEQDEDSITVGWLPLYHDMGLIGNVLQPLFTGSLCILMSPIAFLQSPFRWLQAISRYRATTSGGPNFAYDLCVSKITPEQRAQLDLSNWSVAYNGSEPVRADTLARFAETFEPCGFLYDAFTPCYGLAESTLLVSVGRKDSAPFIKTVAAKVLERNQVVIPSQESETTRTLVGCGASLPDQRMLIVDPNSFLECAAGEVGEIWLSSPSVTRGYWNQPEATKRDFHAYVAGTGDGPFLRTGDLGFIADDELFITGRLKDLIIIRGLNHYPQDIEYTVEQCHKALRRGGGAAFSVEVDGEERLVVVQEVNQQTLMEADEIINAIRESVAETHELQVDSIILIKPGSLPKTSSGKVQRHACRQMFLDQSLPVLTQWQATHVAKDQTNALPPVPLVRSVEGIAGWLQTQVAAKLGIDPAEVDIHEPLSRYGLDSLMAIELMHSIEVSLDANLPIANFLRGPSLAQLAAEVLAEPSALSRLNRLSQKPTEDATYPLSQGQQSLWFMHKLSPESTAYNIARAVRIRSRLEVGALQRALQKLVDRHPSLRTTFSELRGSPVQLVHEQVECYFENVDVSTWSEQKLNARLAEESQRPFDLERGPLLRVFVFARSAQEYMLLLVVHHIIVDFWSLAVLAGELSELYIAEKSGTVAALPPLARQYTDYVSFQTEMLAGEEGERLWDYWRKQLAGALPTLDLPADHARPLIQSFRGASLLFKLNAGLTQQLKALGQIHSATLYATLLAAFQVLLSRYSGQKDLIVGTPTTGRPRAELSGVIGFFVNPLAIRADLSGNPSFEQLLEQTRRTVLEAFEHQEYSFTQLVEHLQPVRDTSRSPLFQVMFTLQKAPLLIKQGLSALALGESGARIEWGGHILESLSLEHRTSQFDLSLSIAESAGELHGSIEYSTDLFEAETIRRMSEHFEHLLVSIVADPKQSVSELEMLGAEERREMIEEFNRTHREYEREVCMQELFERQAARTPDALALVFGDEEISYRELNERANQLAHYLRRLGVRAEERVGVLLERSVEMVVALLGVLKAGGAYVPLDPAYPAERLRYMLDDSQICVLLTEKGLAGSVGESDAQILVMDGGDEEVGKQGVENPVSGVGEKNLAYVIYTSGSTGTPKGVAIEHRSAATLIFWAGETFPPSVLAGVLASTSICFDLSVFELFVTLSWGGCVILARNALELPVLNRRDEVRLINTVPSAMSELVRLKSIPETVEVINLAGEALSSTLVADIYTQTGVEQVWNLYGPSEDTTYTTAGQMKSEGGRITIGKGIANTELYILDESQQIVPLGVIGELYIGGDGLARGYLNKPDLTAEKFVPHPFSQKPGQRLYRTGDLARLLSDGHLEFLGRLDHQVKVRGYRIELGEIEAALLRHPSIREAVVLARDDSPQTKRLIAYLVTEPETSLASSELRQHLSTHLPDYMIPGFFQPLAELPLTPNGKVDRQALSLLEVRTGERAGGGEKQRVQTPMEEVLRGIWEEVLGVERVGVEENFFELGGHSLLATQVISRVKEIFDVDLPLRNLFETPTVKGIVNSIVKAWGSSEIVEAIARTYLELENLSDDEVKRRLLE